MLRHRAFETGRFDLGNMVQAVWATAHGHPLAVTDLHGEQFTRLGAHVDPILVLLAPLWWLWPSPDLLLTVQAVAVALGAVPVYRLSRKHLGDDRAALGFALAYLLLPAVQWLTLNEFHPVALACPLLLWAFWFLDEDRLVSFTACAVLAAATKEEIPLVLAGFGLWYALSRGRRVAGAAIAVAGLAWTVVAVKVVIPHFNDGAESSFYSRYSEIGGSPGGVLRTAVNDPGALLSTAFDHGGVHYLLHLMLPLAGLFLLAPVAAAAALPELAINLLSATGTQRSIHFHYTAGVIPPLVVASVLGAGRLVRRRPHAAVPVAMAMVVFALAANYRLGAIPLWRAFPGGEDYQAKAASVSRHDEIAARALRLIPPDVPVAATNSLGAHLSARRRVLSFPFVQDATWIAVDETRPSHGDRILPTPVRLGALRRDPSWRLVFEQDGVLVFRRVN
ncbi:MAG: DUF2079 domain-containing protein [Actinomycetota bacterium]|nr:DUF2079 domain-containing protein [Actinomycetota bacterium]